MRKADKSVMEQELKEVSEQIPLPLLLPHPELQLCHPGNGIHQPRQTLAVRLQSLIRVERRQKLLKSCPVNSNFQ